ncbi:CRISPR-associated endoribonuclease Cas6 [Diplocloster hominis]|uniref:CRISPR-associated endoribonuclease Cas6 n=1 Tax=Diplocloster hominis TaxID=3079010 RepID=UPI0031BB70A3
MKYKFTFPLKNPLTLNTSYNHILQAALLTWLNDKNYQSFLHDTGYEAGNRSYKLFSFSKIFGNHRIITGQHKIIYQDQIHFYISSYDSKFVTYLAENIISQSQLNLNGNYLTPSSFETIVEEYDDRCEIQTLSPICIYSTLANHDGVKKTYYYTPYEQEYSELIRKNLIHKYESYHGNAPEDTQFQIKPMNRFCRESIIFYKKTVIKGWNGKFLISGSKELMDMAVNAGLGSKNSQGFGCVIVNKG